MVNYGPVRGYRLTLNKYDLAAYRPSDIPPCRKIYHISAWVVDTKRHGISEVFLEVYDLTGQEAYDPTLVGHSLGYGGRTYQYVSNQGTYDVVVNRRGYLAIKKRVSVGPNG